MNQTRPGFRMIGVYRSVEMMVKVMSSPVNAVLELAPSGSQELTVKFSGNSVSGLLNRNTI